MGVALLPPFFLKKGGTIKTLFYPISPIVEGLKDHITEEVKYFILNQINTIFDNLDIPFDKPELLFDLLYSNCREHNNEEKIYFDIDVDDDIFTLVIWLESTFVLNGIILVNDEFFHKNNINSYVDSFSYMLYTLSKILKLNIGTISITSMLCVSEENNVVELKHKNNPITRSLNIH
jgi:hypothetical protein